MARWDVVWFLRGAVRPTVTWCLVTAQIGLAAVWALGRVEAKDAAAMLGPFTMMALTFYFKSRDETRPATSEPTSVPVASLTVGQAK